MFWKWGVILRRSKNSASNNEFVETNHYSQRRKRAEEARVEERVLSVFEYGDELNDIEEEKGGHVNCIQENGPVERVHSGMKHHKAKKTMNAASFG